jgi:NitT/TauT family transport system substrate-binding protein
MRGSIFGLRRLVAGCLLLAAMAPGRAQAAVSLAVAYIPIMPMAQLFVMESEGWAKAAGLDLKLTQFSSGPAMVQAMASGKYDVMYVGIGPSMVARANGVPLKVVAACVVEQIALIGQGALAADRAGGKSAADAIRAFTAAEHRKPKIATLPKGSVPDLVLRYWLTRIAKLPADSVDILGMGEDRVQQALLTRSVDAASILEPIVTIVRDRMPDARILVAGGAMFPNQPGAVVAVSERALKENRAAITSLVALQIRATELIHSDPARAARDTYPFLGQGLVPLPTIERAVRSPISHFVSDPHDIIAATAQLRDFSREIGTLSKPVSVKDLFDTAIYEAAARQQ